MLHKYFPSQFIWEVFFYARISSQPLFHLKNPAMQDFYRSFNRDCELVSQLPIFCICCRTSYITISLKARALGSTFLISIQTSFLVSLQQNIFKPLMIIMLGYVVLHLEFYPLTRFHHSEETYENIIFLTRLPSYKVTILL